LQAAEKDITYALGYRLAYRAVSYVRCQSLRDATDWCDG